MATRVYFATNRDPLGPEDKPTGFGPGFSKNGLQDLRFGQAMVEDGKIVSLECLPDTPNDGSGAMFDEIKKKMAEQGRNTLIMIHGYNTTFEQAIVGAAHTKEAYKDANLNVVMFSWPSDGKWGPLKPTEYFSDRHDAQTSGQAFCRGLMKLAGFLRQGAPCGQKIFLLAHSMGNYVMRHTLQALIQQSPSGKPSRSFDVIFSMAADEDHDAFAPEAKNGVAEPKWERLPDLAGQVLVYMNTKDKALLGSEYSKGNEDRMGSCGPANPMNLPSKVVVVDVSRLEGLFDLGHGYYDEIGVVVKDVMDVMAGKESHDIEGRTWVPAKLRYYLG